MAVFNNQILAGSSVASFEHTNTAFADAYAWGWGYNSKGGLMQNNTTNLSSPVLVKADKFRAFNGGSYSGDAQGHVVGVNLDEKLYTCGENQAGQLGDGSTIDKSSPVQVGTLTNWAIAAVGAMEDLNGFVIAVKTDGTLWSWGNGDLGGLGDGQTSDRSSPAQIGSDTDWYDGEQSFENLKRVGAGR